MLQASPHAATRVILRTWWPLSVVGLLMSVELPLLSIVIARLNDPEVNLAAYGGVVFPILLLFEAPVLMLLAVATTLGRDWPAYVVMRRFALGGGVMLVGLHTAVALTPLFDLLVGRLMGIPEAILEPTRIGLTVLIPWTGLIAYRQLQQGLLIRYGRSLAIGLGLLVRLVFVGMMLAFGASDPDISGMVVATRALLIGMIAEVAFTGLYARVAVHRKLATAQRSDKPLSHRRFIAFYTPLALSPLLMFIVLPIGSAGISHMPVALNSLAVWPLVGSLVAVFRGLGLSFHEVVTTLLDRPQYARPLHRVALTMAMLSTALLLLLTSTLLSTLWFARVGALPTHLAELGGRALWIVVVLPGLYFLQSWYQGVLIHTGKTPAVVESIFVFLSVASGVIAFGVWLSVVTGLYMALAGIAVATIAQVGWLWFRSRAPVRGLHRARGNPT